MTISYDDNKYVATFQKQSKDETKIVVETQSERKIQNDERAIVPKVRSEIILKKPLENDLNNTVRENRSIPTMITTTAKIPCETDLEFDKVIIVTVGKVKGTCEEEATETETKDSLQDVIVQSKGAKEVNNKSLFGRDLQVYCAGQRCCMDCCIRLEYCCMGPQRNCFVAYMMFYYFVMQAATSYLVYYLLTRRRSQIQNNNTNIIIGSILIMVLINYIMLCLACSNHCLLSFLLLVLTVVAYSYLLAALSIRFDTDMFWFANTSMAVVALFLILLAFTCYDFTNCRLRAYIVLVSLLSFYVVYYLAREYYRLSLFQRQYTQRQLIFFAFMTVLHGLLLVTTLRRILCCCFIQLSICDYAIGAYILYTMWLQQILCLLHMGSARQC